jgi:hypothetical protein
VLARRFSKGLFRIAYRITKVDSNKVAFTGAQIPSDKAILNLKSLVDFRFIHTQKNVNHVEELDGVALTWIIYLS